MTDLRTFDPERLGVLRAREEAAARALAGPGNVLQAALDHYTDLYVEFCAAQKALDQYLHGMDRWQASPPSGFMPTKAERKMERSDGSIR